MRFDNAFHQAQAQADSGDLRVANGLAAIKGIEDMRQIVGSDSGTMIFHTDAHAHAARMGDSLGAYAYPATAGGILHSIVEQVLQTIDDGIFVDCHRRQIGVDKFLHAHASLAQGGPTRRQRPAHDVLGRNWGDVRAAAF